MTKQQKPRRKNARQRRTRRRPLGRIRKMGITFTESHDCHQKGGICRATCCPISLSAPVETCPKTHKVKER